MRSCWIMDRLYSYEYTKDVHELRPDGEKVKVNFDIRAVGVYDAATREVISW